jgi:hypothetical protein
VGGCATTAPCTVTVNANVTVTATFGLAPPGFFTLQVTKQGDGTGTVGTNPAAVACGFLCSATLPGGTVLTVTATPDPGARFTGWSGGGCSGTDPCDVTLNAHTPITATFIQSAIVTGTGTGGGAHVRGFTATGAASPLSFLVYPAGFTGGARVAVGDVNGDGGPDLVTAAGTGGAPHVRVFSAMQPSAVLGEFFAYDLGYTGGLFIAAGDLDGDGKAEIVTGVGPGGGPHVRAFTRDPGGAFVEVRSFFAYAPEFSGGISVAACDVNGDGRADIVTGAGPGGGPHVQVFSGATGASIASFFPYDTGLTAGIFVACGDVDGDGGADIVTGVGAGGGPHVTVTRVNGDGTLTTLASFFAYDPGARVGMRVATADLDGDGRAEILTAPGTGGGPHVKGFRRNPDGSVTEAASFFAYDPGFLGGVFVGGAP